MCVGQFRVENRYISQPHQLHHRLLLGGQQNVLCLDMIPETGQSQAVEVGGEIVQRFCAQFVVDGCRCKVGLRQPVVRADPWHGVKGRAQRVGVDGAVAFPHALLEQFYFLLVRQFVHVHVLLFL